MSDLDKKLEEIIFGDMPKHSMSDDMLAKPEQIKQAFIAAGWRDVMHLEDRAKRGQFVTNKRVELLSGKEWYDRFIESLDVKFSWIRKSEYERYMFVIEQCKGAAKKAAGLGKD